MLLNDEVLSVEEVAEYLKVSTQTVRKLIKKGKLPYFMVGNSYRVLMNDILKYLINK